MRCSEASSALLPLVDSLPDHTAAPEADETLGLIKRHLSPGAALSGKVLGGGALEVSAEGALVGLSDGRQVIDFGSYGVTLLGHRHPSVIAAILSTLDRMPTSTRILPNGELAAFAGALSDRCGERLNRVWLGSDGSDAVEAALKLSRRATGRMRVLAVEGGFHGKTIGALALTSGPAFRSGLEPLLCGVSILSPTDPSAVAREAAHGDVAAVIFEPIQGEGGVRPLPQGVLHQWAADAHDAGAFVISDEIQVGLGRCGSFSPSLAIGLDPDAVLLGKALGGGLIPISAVVATDAFAAALVADPTWHTSTFSGHPLSCAAGRAALQALDDAAVNGAAVSSVLEAGLTRLGRDHPEVITEVRGEGLIWGIELASPGAAGAALLELATNGLLVSPCLSSNRTIRLLPPMVTEIAQVEAALQILGSAMAAVHAYI